MNPNFAELFNRHAIASFDKQLALTNLVAEQEWALDLSSGILEVGKSHRWSVQLLGFESAFPHRWRWAWAERRQDLPEHLLQSADFLRAMGELLLLRELTDAELDLSALKIDGHYLALLATGVCQANAYYRAPVSGGSLFLLILDEHFPRPQHQALERILPTFTQTLQHLSVSNHRTALLGYLRFYGLEPKESGALVCVEEQGQTVLTATFDPQNQLVVLDGVLPRPPLANVRPARLRINRKPVVAFGPEMPGWGSWDWVGADLLRELEKYFNTRSFCGQEVPDCDVLVVVKHPLKREVIASTAQRAAVIYCPVDAYGSPHEILADAAMLSLCNRIVIHCEKLRPYFAAYAPVEYLDHHVKFVAPQRRQMPTEGPILWIGVRSNLAPLVQWVNSHPLPGELLVLTNPEVPGQMPSAGEFGFQPDRTVRVSEWSPELHLQSVLCARAALDIKGSDFRAAHKPPAKALDYLASGLPLAMNPESSSVEHLAKMGFDLADPLDAQRWLSRDYWEETRRFGAALRELLSLERVGRRFKRLIDEILASG